MNMQGRVTDAQLWSKILSMEEMVATTSCKSFPEGDLLPWNSQSWHLNTSRETATIENLDLQDEVCGNQDLVLLPQLFSGEIEAEHICRRISARIASYTDQRQLSEIHSFLQRENLDQASDCFSGDQVVAAWLAPTDSVQEGVWRDRYTEEEVVYLPWQEHRPYDGGFAYNCLLARFQLGSNQSEVEITDEECGSKFCLSCRLETPTLRLLVRGLCSDSIFEQFYTYTLGEQGPMLVGDSSSVIFFSSEESSWLWIDRKDPQSSATIQ